MRLMNNSGNCGGQAGVGKDNGVHKQYSTARERRQYNWRKIYANSIVT